VQRAKSVMLITVSAILLASAIAEAQQDLRVIDTEIQPVPGGVYSARIQLHTYRSYRHTVTIQKSVALEGATSFVVRTECIRNGEKVTIGEARVGDSTGWYIYACYDLFPGQAGTGDCLMRTTVDYNNEVQESDESAASNIWDRQVSIPR